MNKIYHTKAYNSLSLQPRKWFVWLLALLALYCYVNTVHAKPLSKGITRILYINSYHRDYTWSDKIEQSLKKGLKDSKKKIELSVEYLDTLRFKDKSNLENIAATLRQKYADYPFDIIVTSDNAAFDFVIKNRERMFAGLPIVFCGYNNFRLDITEGMKNITGVNEEVDFSGTIELALSVHPTTSTIAFILSTMDITSQRDNKTIEETILPKYRDRFKLAIIRDASMKEISNRLSHLPKNTIVLIAGKTSDNFGGRNISPVENGKFISSASSFPTYSFWNFHIGIGVLGGRVITGTDQGRAAADMVLQIIDGKKTNNIPIILNSPASNIFDFEVMQRFNIKQSQLPTGSTIINRPFSVWDTYRWQILVALAILIIETILIFLLVIAMRKRKIAEKMLYSSNIKLEEKVEQRTASLQQSNDSLREALAEIKKLSGLLPICAQCKKIRDDKGYWNQIEGYIQTHSEAKFSHSMCPECSDELYSKEDWYIEMKKEKGDEE